MSALDLTAAVEAGHSVWRVSYYNGVLIADIRERMIRAAAPLIEAAVREMVAAEIEAFLDSPDGPSIYSIAGMAYADSARIARRRGESA